MAELLIIAYDTPHPDPITDTKRYKAGDVVIVQPDGFEWGVQERINPLFRILKLPNVPVPEGEGFLGPQLDQDPVVKSRMLLRRAFHIDFDNAAIPAKLKSWLTDNSRAAPAFTSNITVAQIRQLKAERATVPDPDIIGDEAPNVL